MKVMVTGAGGGLGPTVADLFERHGHAVFRVARTPRDGVGGFDLVDPAAAARAFDAAEKAMGGVTAVVNLAGGFRYATLRDGGLAAWEAMFAANVKTCLNACLVAAERLPDGGAIVNVGAAAAARAAAGMGAYAASKSGVARLTESLAAELAGRIRVNAVLPRTIDTPQNRRDMPDADPAAWTSPEAIAEVILFLCSPQGRAVNGALIEAANAG